jgi:ATP-dependent protease ClpP protease subunit
VGFGGDSTINVFSAGVIIRGLPYLINKGHEDITIEINTDGGDVDQGFAMIDMIEEAKSVGVKIHCIVRGCCYSMGVAILQAGSTRGMTKYSSIMIHDGETHVSTTSRQARKNWQTFHKLQDKWYTDLLLHRMQQTNPQIQRKKLVDWMSAETIFTAEESLKQGLVDYIVGQEVSEEVKDA